MILRVCLVIVPALVAAATYNDTLMVWVFFISRIYSFIKYLAFGATYGMCLKIVANIESVSISSPLSLSTGSTNTSLKAFQIKLRVGGNYILFFMCPCVAGSIAWLLVYGRVAYGMFDFTFIVVRGVASFWDSICLEILYLDIFPLLLERLKRWKTKGSQESYPNTATGNFGIKARGVDGGSFDSKNPTREAQDTFPNPIL